MYIVDRNVLIIFSIKLELFPGYLLNRLSENFWKKLHFGTESTSR